MATISMTTTTTMTTSTSTSTATAMVNEPRKSYDELCRLCASYDAFRMHIFGQEGKNRQLVDKIQTCLSFKIIEDDCLPKVLCYPCMYNLENFYDFRTACVNAAAWLERNRPKEGASDDGANDIAQFDEVHAELLKGKENMPVLIPETPVVNPNAPLGTTPRLNSDNEADPEIEEILDTSKGTDEATVIDDSEDRRSEYEMDMETNPSDFLEITPMVTEENEEECGRAKENRSLSDLIEEEESMNLSMQTQENALMPFVELKILKDRNYVNKPVGCFACSRCGRSYKSKYTLQRHEQLECGKEPQFKCPFCPQRCKRKEPWQNHIRHQHKDKVDMEEYLRSNMPKLKLVGRFACSRCGRSYTLKKSLKRHEHWECGKEPQFKCPFCPQRSKHKSNWQRHIRKWHTDKVDMEEYLHSNMPKLEFD
ncbi:uncharacterized protein [Temnothorax longispinosus]|uniref:uncharacterized protein isoform X1 n=1 Tax=Temnothorax longispinosus TaxID=300112 RepID=UPI003A99671E